MIENVFGFDIVPFFSFNRYPFKRETPLKSCSQIVYTINLFFLSFSRSEMVSLLGRKNNFYLLIYKYLQWEAL